MKEQAILDLLSDQKALAIQNAKTTLEPIGNDPDEALYVLNDQDAFQDIYTGILTENELEELFNSFGQIPFTDKIGDVEMDLWIQAATELDFPDVVKMLEQVKEHGV